MSEEELNQELKADELKDVSGGFEAKVGGQAQVKGKKENDSVYLGPIGHDGIALGPIGYDGISKSNSSVDLGPIGHDGIASKGKRKTP